MSALAAFGQLLGVLLELPIQYIPGILLPLWQLIFESAQVNPVGSILSLVLTVVVALYCSYRITKKEKAGLLSAGTVSVLIILGPVAVSLLLYKITVEIPLIWTELAKESLLYLILGIPIMLLASLFILVVDLIPALIIGVIGGLIGKRF